MRPSDEAGAVRELSEDLEPTDETAADITEGDVPAGAVNIRDISIMRVVDKSSPILSP